MCYLPAIMGVIALSGASTYCEYMHAMFFIGLHWTCTVDQQPAVGQFENATTISFTNQFAP